MSENAFSLIVCLPGEEPSRHDLAGDSVTFGRSPENNIQMLVAEVSVRHGRLDRDGDGYRIIDPGSTNGTRLNGAPVGPDGAALKPMDRLVIGTVVNAFFVPAAILASTSPAELVASLEASKAPATPKTAAVAVSATPAAPAAPGAPAAPVRPAAPAAPGAPARAAIPVGGSPPAPASPGGTTVKLDQVRGPGVRPAAIPAPPRAPATGVPAAPAAPIAPGGAPAAVPVRPAGAVPLKPPGAAPVRPAAPPAQPGRPPVAPGAAPAPGGVQPIPLKRPAPSNPTIPLPKTPPKPGQ
jgi:hypothetical protein